MRNIIYTLIRRLIQIATEKQEKELLDRLLEMTKNPRTAESMKDEEFVKMYIIACGGVDIYQNRFSNFSLAELKWYLSVLHTKIMTGLSNRKLSQYLTNMGTPISHTKVNEIINISLELYCSLIWDFIMIPHFLKEKDMVIREQELMTKEKADKLEEQEKTTENTEMEAKSEKE